MTDRMAEADAIAREFHETYERMAPTFGYVTRARSAVPWDEVPATNKSLMRSVVIDLLQRNIIAADGGLKM